MKQFRTLLFLFSILILVAGPSFLVRAQTAEELQSKIDDRNNNIKQLEDEIKSYQSQIDTLGKQANSLKNTLAELDLSQKKIQADLQVTENKIASTNLQIQELSLQITDKGDRIDTSKRVIAQSLTGIAESDSNSVLENLLGAQSLADVWRGSDELNTLQTNVSEKIHELQTIKSSLEDNKVQTLAKKAELVKLDNDLSNQKKVLAETVKEKNSLLVTTKNTEANYQKTLAQKEAQKNAFEQEVLAYESALKLIVDPSKIPHTGSGVLNYPLDKITITQYFGNTPFATANPQIYNGKGHTGVDFAASIGTPVKAALGGIVVGVANTDIVPGCYSFGKWVMIKHPNGLSTLYAHLSLQTVTKGDAVSTGQIIGYSGNTGYTTGPHLHFGVYATDGVQITTFTNSIHCKGATIPLAELKAYLNPLSFL